MTRKFTHTNRNAQTRGNAANASMVGSQKAAFPFSGVSVGSIPATKITRLD